MSKKYSVIVQSTSKIFGWFASTYNHVYEILADNEKRAKKLAVSNCAESNRYAENFEIISCVELVEPKPDKDHKEYYVGVSANIIFTMPYNSIKFGIGAFQEELKEPIKQYVCQEVKFIDLKNKSEEKIKEYATGKFKEFVTNTYLKEKENTQINDITVNYIK